MKKDFTFLTTEELAERIKYDPATIRNSLKDSVLIKDVHYIWSYGGRKVLCLWECIQANMFKRSQLITIPMENGGEHNGSY